MIGLTTLLVQGRQTLQGLLSASTSSEACYNECSDVKDRCERSCSAKVRGEMTQPATCLKECKHSFKSCLQVCDEDFPDASAVNAKVSVEPDYAPRQYLAQLGSRGSSGMTVTTAERVELSSGRNQKMKSGSKKGSSKKSSRTATLTVVVQHDSYPYETSWLLNSGSSTIGYQIQGSIYTPGWVVSQSFTVTAGVYVFAMSDSGGDGVCCEYGAGYWALYLDGYLFSYSSFVAGYGEQLSFTVG
jgi:hypothetical protein